MIDAALKRAMMLFESNRPELAENEVKRVLAEKPDEPVAHALFALCRLRREDYSTALRESAEAVRLDPGLAYVRFVAGHVMLASNWHESALREADAAIALEPTNASYYALLGSVHLDCKRWGQALEAAEKGLELDPENVECNNLRAMALVKLGRRSEAGATIRDALALDPEDAFTHANQGWTYLHERKPEQAMEHFKEALRIDPTMDWARAGIVEALKSKNFIYRWMLAWFLFMARLSGQAQWMIIIGGWVAMQALKNVGASFPAAKPFILPVVIAYMVFAALTWIAYPLFNLLLRLNRYGRLALSREQVIGANCIGVTLACAIIALITSFVMEWQIMTDVAMIFGLITLPLAAVFTLEKGWPRSAMAAAIALLFLLGAAHVWRMYNITGLSGRVTVDEWNKTQWLTKFSVGVLVVMMVGNALAHAKVRKG